MMKFLFFGAFAAGILVILWIGRIFLGADNLGLGVTVLIAAVYVLGTLELLQFRRATATLRDALLGLSETCQDLPQWLATLAPSLQSSVGLRVQGQRNGLPAPVFTPYLVGLLVMLGLLGTFVGMVDTLKGAVLALEGNSELEAIRAGLAAPIEGLGLAFGTSVAGVAASAMLGLLSTLSRRERMQASYLLDSKLARELREFSSSYQQQKAFQAFQAIQDQAQALPEVAGQLAELAKSLTSMGEGLSQSMLENQGKFQSAIGETYSDLNSTINQSLKKGLLESSEILSSSIQPIVNTTMSELSSMALETNERLSNLGEQQFKELHMGAKANSDLVQKSVDASITLQSESSKELLAAMHQTVEKTTGQLQASTAQLLTGFSSSSDEWNKLQKVQATTFSQAIRDELNSLRKEEQGRGDAAVARLDDLQAAVAAHLATLGNALEEPMARLIETASHAPKAAADVIEKLRDEMTKNFERDNSLLSERKTLMQQLDELSKSLSSASQEQGQAIDSLIERSAETLAQVGNQFGEKLEGESEKLAGVIEHFASSSAEMASLGDAFNAAVALFSESNNQLVENLTRIEASLEQSSNRSDEQLAYYVAQAREIIDHNLLSHQQIIAALHAQKPTQLTVAEASS